VKVASISGTEFFVTKDGSTIRELHRTEVQSLAEATLEPDEATQLTLDGFAKDQNSKQQRAQMTVEIPMLHSEATKSHGLLWMDKTVWQQSIDFMSTAKLLTKPVSVDDVMTNDILDRVG